MKNRFEGAGRSSETEQEDGAMTGDRDRGDLDLGRGRRGGDSTGSGYVPEGEQRRHACC